MKKALIYILLAISLGCIETFEPNFELDTSGIVITGIITDLDPVQVEISKPVFTRNVKFRNVERVSGASVILYDDQGNQEELVEKKKGYYEGAAKGVVGRKYHINVYLPDNSLITSPPQILNPCPSIDSISIEQVRFMKTFGNVEIDFKGLNLNLEMNSSDTLSRYYKWTIGGTYRRYSAFDVYRQEPPCYVTIPAHFNFILGQSVYNNSNFLSKKLKFITPNGTYAEGHSVEVTQYALNKEAYNYWKKIDDQQSNVGSVFDPPPAQIETNLSYTDDRDNFIIGFFEVSSAKKTRIFIRPTDFPGVTKLHTTDLNALCSAPAGIIGFEPPRWCNDCSLLKNSTKTKPSYWPE